MVASLESNGHLSFNWKVTAFEFLLGLVIKFKSTLERDFAIGYHLSLFLLNPSQINVAASKASSHDSPFHQYLMAR